MAEPTVPDRIERLEAGAAPHPPTREQIVKAILPVMANDWDRMLAPSPTRIANAVLTLIQNGANR